jgi:hypothetical protein
VRTRAQLSPEEVDFMTTHMTEGLAAFHAVSDGDATCKTGAGR